jgi:hypothetical protein
MQPPSHFGFQELYNHVVGDIAKSLSTRNGESPGVRSQRVQAAVHMVMGFLPRDVIEALLAGHCVMFHELMVDSVRHTLAGEVDTMRRGSRAGIVAMDRCFASNLRMLEHYQRRPAEWERDAPAAADTAAAAMAMEEPPDLAASPAVGVEASAQSTAETAPISPPAGAAAASEPESVPGVPYYPSPRTVADILAAPGALEALEAGDAAAFAQAMGVECPSEEYLAAAALPGGPFDCSAHGGNSAATVTWEPSGADFRRGQSTKDSRGGRIVPVGE